jgi:excisionase family DNA binding protein
MSASISGLAKYVVKFPLRTSGRESMPKWASYSVKEASRASGYSEQYLRRLIRQGKIKGVVKVGPAYLIPVESLDAYIEEMQATDDARTGPRSEKQE